MINFSKFHKNITLIPLFITLVCCQLKEPVKNHGILFLENRSNQLKISQSNKNDVIGLIGNPHTISFNNNNDVRIGRLRIIIIINTGGRSK